MSRYVYGDFVSELGSTSSTWVIVWYFKYRVLEILKKLCIPSTSVFQVPVFSV